MLWVGSYHHAGQFELLRKLGIDCVVNVAEEVDIAYPQGKGHQQEQEHEQGQGTVSVSESESGSASGTATVTAAAPVSGPNPVPGGNFLVYKFPFKDVDSDADLMYSQLRHICSLMHRLIAEGHQILVHCQLGISRSVTVAMAYCLLYAHKQMPTLAEVIEQVTERRSFSRPNWGFLKMLQRLEKQQYKLEESTYQLPNTAYLLDSNHQHYHQQTPDMSTSNSTGESGTEGNGTDTPSSQRSRVGMNVTMDTLV